jgi:hypothetical protein
VFSEEEKQDLQEMAASVRIREEFALLSAASRDAQAQVGLDQYVRFLTTMARLSPIRPLPRLFVLYQIVRI